MKRGFLFVLPEYKKIRVIVERKMSEREEKFEKMLRAVLEEYDTTVEKMEKLKGENKSKTVTYKQLMATKLTLQNLITRYEVYGLIDK